MKRLIFLTLLLLAGCQKCAVKECHQRATVTMTAGTMTHIETCEACADWLEFEAPHFFYRSN